MKKLLITVVFLLLLPLFSEAQLSTAQKWVSSFEGRPGVTVVSISRAMFKMLSKLKPSDPGYQDVVRFASRLQEFKIIVADNDDPKNKAASAELNRLIGNASLPQYEELMSVSDGGSRIVFQVLEQDDHIRELLMRITGSEQVILFIKGDFKLAELTDISGDMNISGLNKVQKLKK